MMGVLYIRHFVHLTVFYTFISPVTLHLQLLDPPPRPVLDTPLHTGCELVLPIGLLSTGCYCSTE